ncbi:hypothetical protein CCR75_000247 [Bremia lactucae]|uniref:Nucleoporin protein Ndc1-Nup n=1 Tax=Bremia lactucae TaxID=4779 RepID=A0A976FDK6_BRELC|nr:hypothetical protein CCR75_000247 [Bremia lactucae]
MGFAHSLEVLYALLRLYVNGVVSSFEFSNIPYPHLQQRLQQTLRAVALTVFGAVITPLVVLCFEPLLSPLEFPGFTAFILVTIALWVVTIFHLTLRFALLPTPRRIETEPVRGRLQAAVCVIVDAVKRVQQQPQLPILIIMCVAHSYAWKLVLYNAMASNAFVAMDFESFAISGGLVAFISFMLFENSLVDDPFVLDPRAAFSRAMKRDIVRAIRRGVLVYVVGRVWSWLFSSNIEAKLTVPETWFFSLNVVRVSFQVTTSVLENFALLSATSVFRILLFRPSHQVVSAAILKTNNLWDALATVKAKNEDGLDALFSTVIVANPQTTLALHEQYVQGLRNRMDAAAKMISDKRTPKAPADAEDVQIIDSLFKFDNLLCGCKFNAAARGTLFVSRDRWNVLFSSTTAVVDEFTLMLQMLNSLPEKKGDADDNSPTGPLALEQSVAALHHFLNTQRDVHSLFLLQQYPHLANLRISTASVKSSIRFFVESKLQFAIRRNLMIEARRRVFDRVKVVNAAVSLLCHLVSASRSEDKQGFVQHTVPAVLTSLVECHNALIAYMETCLNESKTTKVYVKQATGLAKGVDSGIYRITECFRAEFSLFAFPPSVKTALHAYTSFDE